MPGGVWLDLLLLVLIVTGVVLLSRLLPAPSLLTTGEGRGEAEPPVTRRWAARLANYYPTVTRQAGFRPESGRWFYWLAKYAMMILLPLALLELWPAAAAPPAFAWVLLVALVGFVLADLWLLGVRRARKRRVAQALSYYLDLLVAFLHSGLGLEEAFRRAGREGLPDSHPLAREVELVGSELDAGRDPGTAFEALAQRTGVTDLRGIASSLRLGMRLGNPVRSTLQAQADILWTKQREAALRRINAATTKAVLPVVLCGFPIFIVLVFFPAILEIVEAFRELFGVWR